MGDFLKIQSNSNSPEITYNPYSGYLNIKGRSYADDITDIYNLLLERVKNFRRELSLEVTLDFEYIDTYSIKILTNFLFNLKKICKLSIVWIYEFDDEDMKNLGDRLEKTMKIPLKLSGYH